MQIVALDKTGTITSGEPSVTDVIPAPGTEEEELIRFAASLEQKSEHPLAKAVLVYAKERGVALDDAEDFRALPGNGLSATVDGAPVTGGSYKYMKGQVPVSAEFTAHYERLSGEGKTPLFFAKSGKLLGLIAVADTMKEDSAQAIGELKKMGIYVVMLTGDNERTAAAIGRQAGVNEVIAGVLPDGKEAVIRRLQEKGKVAMVGDGINDAPALTRAETGIAIGAGTDVAIDAADVVLMKSRLTDVSAAIRLSRRTYRNILENLFWALIYNTLLIPLAAGVYTGLLGWSMNPMWGAAAMSLSSFCVVSNALRLNLMNIHDASHDRPGKDPVATNEDGTVLEHTKEKEITSMTKTLKVEGMMCMHCEATVKKALEALEGVAEAKVSHTEGTAVVTLTADVADDVLKAAVEAKDYTVLGVE